MSSTYLRAKRVIDFIVAAAVLVILSPALLACALAVRITSVGPALYHQARVGRYGRVFDILKFRTMTDGASGPSITEAGDARITRLGRVLRRYKIDELPQLLNVLHGDMSLVGPRPELERYVDLFPLEYSRILMVRPGMTDFAAIEYCHEEKILALSADSEFTYVDRILPAKIELYLAYLDRVSLRTDLSLLGKTLRAVIA